MKYIAPILIIECLNNISFTSMWSVMGDGFEKKNIKVRIHAHNHIHSQTSDKQYLWHCNTGIFTTEPWSALTLLQDVLDI